MDNYKGYTIRRARKALVRAFINKYNFLHEDQNNVLDGGKVFVVNSVVGWCLKQRAEKKISLTEMQYYVSLLQEYIDGRVDLSWNNQMLEVLVKE